MNWDNSLNFLGYNTHAKWDRYPITHLNWLKVWTDSLWHRLFSINADTIEAYIPK